MCNIMFGVSVYFEKCRFYLQGNDNGNNVLIIKPDKEPEFE